MQVDDKWKGINAVGSLQWKFGSEAVDRFGSCRLVHMKMPVPYKLQKLHEVP